MIVLAQSRRLQKVRHGNSQTQYFLIVCRFLPRQVIARLRVLVLGREGGFSFGVSEHG